MEQEDVEPGEMIVTEVANGVDGTAQEEIQMLASHAELAVEGIMTAAETV